MTATESCAPGASAHDFFSFAVLFTSASHDCWGSRLSSSSLLIEAEAPLSTRTLQSLNSTHSCEGYFHILRGGRRAQAIPVPPVEIHFVQTDPDRRGRARFLKHLLKANHVRSKLPMTRCTPNQLHDIRVQGLEVDCRSWKHGRHRQPSWWTATGRTSWETSSTADQRAYLDYFVDKLAIDYAYGWKELRKRLGIIFGHALIQLGLAYEVDSKEIAMEALALASVQKDFLYDYSSDSSLNKISSISSDSILDLLDLIGVQRRGAG
ncbi:hypothetical protein E4U44_006008 [Claviceps purpurea]|nr:hypothetical protein E4U44_006008 [Claviceps purpurea]